MLAAMSAQRIATGIGLVALAGLLLSIGLPTLLPPAPVAEIEIVVPAGDSDEPAESPETIPPGRLDDDADDADDPDDAGDDSPGDADDADDDPDDAGDDSPDDGDAGDGPDDSLDDSPDDDGDDGDD
jgi:hypothetical protein